MKAQEASSSPVSALSKKGGWTLKLPGTAPVMHFLQLFLLKVPQPPCKTALVGEPAFKYMRQWDAPHSNHRILSKGPFEEDLDS